MWFSFSDKLVGVLYGGSNLAFLFSLFSVLNIQIPTSLSDAFRFILISIEEE